MIHEVQTQTFNIDTPRVRSQLLAAVLLPYSVFWLMTSFLFIMIGILFQDDVFPFAQKKFVVLMFVGAPLYLGLLVGYSAVKLIRRSFGRLRLVPGASLIKCTFSETHFGSETEAGTKGQLPYSLIHRMNPESDGIMVITEVGRFLWIPRNSFMNTEEFELASRWCSQAQIANSAKNTVSMRT